MGMWSSAPPPFTSRAPASASTDSIWPLRCFMVSNRCAFPGRDEEVGEQSAPHWPPRSPPRTSCLSAWMAAGSLLPRAVRSGWARPRPALIDEHQFPSPRVMVGGRDFETWLGERSKKFRRRSATTTGSWRRPGSSTGYRPIPPTSWSGFPTCSGSTSVAGRPGEARARVRRPSWTWYRGLSRIRRRARAAVDHRTARRGDRHRPDHQWGWRIELLAEWLRRGVGSIGAEPVNLALCIGDSMQRDDAVFDLGPGAEPYKNRFTSDEVMLQGRPPLAARPAALPHPGPAVAFRRTKAAARLVGRLRTSA